MHRRCASPFLILSTPDWQSTLNIIYSNNLYISVYFGGNSDHIKCVRKRYDVMRAGFCFKKKKKYINLCAKWSNWRLFLSDYSDTEKFRKGGGAVQVHSAKLILLPLPILLLNVLTNFKNTLGNPSTSDPTLSCQQFSPCQTTSHQEPS